MSLGISSRIMKPIQELRIVICCTLGLLLFGALLPSGCSRRTVPRTGSGGMSGTLGLGRSTTAEWGRWDDGMVFIIWSDLDGGYGGGSYSGGEARYEGRQSSRDGRGFDWRCATSDGTTGTVTINKVTYDLSNGSVFLVRARGEKQRVEQLDRDTLILKPGPESLATLAKDPEIREFFSN